MSDQTIIRLLFARAEQALELLAHRFGARLLQTASNILSNLQDAEECVNDTYYAVWNAIPPREPDPLSGFVYKTGRNLALKRLRDNTAGKRDSRYDLSLEELIQITTFANHAAALTCSRSGAIPAMPSLEELTVFLP